jgi:glucokinase
VKITGPAAQGREFSTLGIDVGGTKIAAGLVAFPEGRLQLRRQIPSHPGRGGAAVLRDVSELARQIAAEALSLELRIGAIGVGICELVNIAGEIVSANCLTWRSGEVREALAPIAPVIIEADVRAAALAEASFGAGKSHRIFIYVTIGTGISSCLVMEGRPYPGARGLPGTVASSPLPQLAEASNSGSALTLEQIASGPALVARFNELHGNAQSGQEVLAAASAGNADALNVVRSAAEAMGATIGWLVNVLDPEAVVIGGGLGLSEGAYWEELEASTRKHIWSEIHRDLPIVRAATGQDAGLIGAAAAAWKRFVDLRRRSGG